MSEHVAPSARLAAAPLARSAVILFLLATLGMPVGAQAPENARPLRVFITCVAVHCDIDHFRRELTFVDYVRDRKEADVHVLITALQTGSAGREVTLRFIHGQEERTLRRVTAVDATEEAVRALILQALKLGLVFYVADTPVGNEIQIQHRATKAAQTAPTADRWNYWVFRPQINMFMSGESTNRSISMFGSLSANRVTEASKIMVSLNGNYRESTFRLENDRRVTAVTNGRGLSALVVKSLGSHWSAGAEAALSSSTFVNQDVSIRLAPAFEYNFFPYSESTRRQLTVQYGLGPVYNDYRQVTIFDKLTERLMRHNAEVALSLRQPWGTLNNTFEASQFLGDLRKHQLTAFTNAQLRLVRGLSLNFNLGIFRIRDQIYLTKGEATTEEVLLRQRQLATSYRYFFSTGVSYSFGSIFNNVVNTRFRRSGIEFF